MTTLREELAQAEAHAAELRRRIAATTCAEAGCDMQHVGGCNAGCGDACVCSVPVHVCPRCGDSDYGDNPEAEETRRRCERGLGE